MTPEQQQAFQDLQVHLDTAARHMQAYTDPEADAYHELHSAVNALGALVSGADALLAPLAEELVARQTDRGDQLGEFFSEVVGDREYAIDPDGGAS